MPTIVLELDAEIIHKLEHERELASMESFHDIAIALLSRPYMPPCVDCKSITERQCSRLASDGARIAPGTVTPSTRMSKHDGAPVCDLCEQSRDRFNRTRSFFPRGDA